MYTWSVAMYMYIATLFLPPEKIIGRSWLISRCRTFHLTKIILVDSHNKCLLSRLYETHLTIMNSAIEGLLLTDVRAKMSQRVHSNQEKNQLTMEVAF